MCNQEVRKCNIQHSEHQKECCFLCQFLLTKLFFIKSSGMAQGLINAQPLGSTKFANAPPLGLTRRANALQ